jgi:hypothetical protein
MRSRQAEGQPVRDERRRRQQRGVHHRRGRHRGRHQAAGLGQPLLDKIKSVTDKPVTRIINTHTHFDHTSGNVEFPATVDVVTHENTKTYMEQANPVYGLQTGPQTNIFKENGGKGMPKRTFKDKMTLGKGADQIDLYYFGRAHTGGDAYVVFPALRVMHVGDTIPTRDMPIMDKNNGGSAVEFSRRSEGRGGERRRHDHQRPQPDDDDAGGSEALLGVHRRLREVRAGREEGGQERGRRGEHLEDTGQVHRLPVIRQFRRNRSFRDAEPCGTRSRRADSVRDAIISGVGRHVSAAKAGRCTRIGTRSSLHRDDQAG